MSYHEKVLGLGLPLVDIKFHRRSLKNELPTNDDDSLLKFVDTHHEATNIVGGMIPNTLTAYSRFRPESSVRLIGRVGKDNRGQFYSSTYEKSLGELQIDQKESTGFVAIVVDENGSTYGSKSFDGASQNVQAPEKETLERTEMLITNANILRIPSVVEQARLSLEIVRKKHGIFIFSLGGARPSKTTRETMWKNLFNFPSQPDVVFSNEDEIRYVSGQENISGAIDASFPNSRLIVVTLGSQGTIFRFEGKIIEVPATTLSGRVIEAQGAGDTFMGVMLAVLNQQKYHKWNFLNVSEAAQTATYAASLVIQSIESQLQPKQAEKVKRYYQNKGWKNWKK